MKLIFDIVHLAQVETGDTRTPGISSFHRKPLEQVFRMGDVAVGALYFSVSEPLPPGWLNVAHQQAGRDTRAAVSPFRKSEHQDGDTGRRRAGGPSWYPGLARVRGSRRHRRRHREDIAKGVVLSSMTYGTPDHRITLCVNDVETMAATLARHATRPFRGPVSAEDSAHASDRSCCRGSPCDRQSRAKKLRSIDRALLDLHNARTYRLREERGGGRHII